LNTEELIRRHPRLWHMAADGTWPGICERGLLSVSRLLDAYGVEGDARLPIESARRPECVTLSRAGMPDAIIRDNKPIIDSKLAKCLQDGLTTRQWYEILNGYAFFWAQRERLERLLGAGEYAEDPQIVIEIDTARLLERHADRIRLSPINSGQTFYKAQERGLSTFRRIAEFPDSGSGRMGSRERPKVVEVVVEDGVPDLMEVIVRADRLHNGASEQVWG
jgi:hypothetical protein